MKRIIMLIAVILLSEKIRKWEINSAARIKAGREPVPKPVEPSENPALDRNFPGSSITGMIPAIAGLYVKGIIFHHGYNNALKDSRPKSHALEENQIYK